MTSRRGPLRRRRARSIPPTTTASILLKSCAMPPVSWPTASIFWTWRSCASAAMRSLGLGLQRGVGVLQLLRRFGHGLLERLGALAFAFGLAPRRGILAQRLDRDPAEEDRAEPDEHAEPAQIIGQPVGLGGEELGLLHPLASARRARCSAISSSLSRSCGPGRRQRRGVIIAGAARAAPGDCRARRSASSSPRRLNRALQLVDPLALVGIAGDQFVELLDLVPGKPPLVVIDVAAGLDLLVEHEAAERGFGARDGRVDACGSAG